MCTSVAVSSCIKISGDHIFTNSSETSFGSRVKLTCETGYELAGDTSVVICQPNGQWSPAVPTCSLKSKTKYILCRV